MAQAILVSQTGSKNRRFWVKNQKKIAFWTMLASISSSAGGSWCLTKILKTRK